MKSTASIQDSDKIISLLARMPLLKQFSREQLGLILDFTSIRIYEFGESIIEEGSLERTFFIMISGAAYVLKNGVQIAAFDKPGDIFGEMTIIDGSARSASIVAQERTICIAIDAAFLERAEDTPQILMVQNILYRAIAGLLAGRIRAMNTDCIALRKELDAVKSGKKSRNA